MSSHVKTSQTAIPCCLMRGGTSRGPFFLAHHLPLDKLLRDRILLAAMGSPDPRQIDGLGGAHPLTSKVGIVSKSSLPDVDLDFLFAQLQPDQESVDTSPNCGNMLAAVVPFALENGLFAVQKQQQSMTLRVRTLNTNMQCDITVPLQHGAVQYDGDTHIDGVPGTAAPISIQFLDTAGSICASLLPTGKPIDTIDIQLADEDTPRSLDLTCIDNGMPLVLIRASDLDCTGSEDVATLNANTLLKARLETIRLHAGYLMGLGDVSHKNYPKMTLISAPQQGGCISTRSFIPHVCHDAIGVLAAVTVATACVLEKSIAHSVAQLPAAQQTATELIRRLTIEHPTGEFSVELGTHPDSPNQVTRAALLRTARLIMRGEVMVPSRLPSHP